MDWLVAARAWPLDADVVTPLEGRSAGRHLDGSHDRHPDLRRIWCVEVDAERFGNVQRDDQRVAHRAGGLADTVSVLPPSTHRIHGNVRWSIPMR